MGSRSLNDKQSFLYPDRFCRDSAEQGKSYLMFHKEEEVTHPGYTIHLFLFLLFHHLSYRSGCGWLHKADHSPAHSKDQENIFHRDHSPRSLRNRNSKLLLTDSKEN